MSSIHLGPDSSAPFEAAGSAGTTATITLPDGSTKTIAVGATALDVATEIGPGLARAALVAEVDGVPTDMATALADGQSIKFLTDRDDAALEHLRHSTAHVLAQAVLELWPGATFAGGPPIADGFYYDFELPDRATFSDDDLAAIDARMREIIAADQPFERIELPIDEAIALMVDHPYKRAFMDAAIAGNAADGEVDAAAGDSATISFYRNTETFVDMCRGPHVPSTGRLGHFKLMRVAGAYFRGSEKNPMLQRIYGTAWASKKDLAAHLNRLEEAKKRDHRRLGVELDLFSFPDEIGSGLAVFHPKGGIIRRLMEDYSRLRHSESGYEFVYSPHITKSTLFETSGHLQWFADGMFPPMELDSDPAGTGADYYLKPMNCPFHILIFKSRQRSYRELPLRMFEFGTVYRYEKSGVIHGLTRVRGMTQDDAHIFTTKELMNEELKSLLVFVLDLLRDYGLDDFYLELSTKPDGKAVGTDEEWEEATAALREVATGMGIPLVDDPGGGAFYGPKISVQARDAIGRTWQMSTIQVDFQLPQRFEMEYVGSDGARHRPIMIHRALFGSVERFFGVLVEHYAGAFPFWLSPVQVSVLPVAAAHDDYAAEVAVELRNAGYRVEVVSADDSLGKRIRSTKGEKVPYILVVGDDDVANRTVGVNPRGGEVERDVPVSTFLERVRPGVGPAVTPKPPVTNRVSAVPMDHLWTTWRANYVTSLSDVETAIDDGATSGSLFERILAAPGDDAQKGIVFRGELSFVLVNRYPYTSGHCMVLPYRAIADLRELTVDEYHDLWENVRGAVEAVNRGFSPHGVNVGLNMGAASGGSQSDHLHVHIVPRWVGDANFMSVIAEVRTMPLSPDEVVERLREVWPTASF